VGEAKETVGRVSYICCLKSVVADPKMLSKMLASLTLQCAASVKYACHGYKMAMLGSIHTVLHPYSSNELVYKVGAETDLMKSAISEITMKLN
jgi:hypothetical protein